MDANHYQPSLPEREGGSKIRICKKNSFFKKIPLREVLLVTLRHVV
jgi:hypothetical protein